MFTPFIFVIQILCNFLHSLCFFLQKFEILELGVSSKIVRLLFVLQNEDPNELPGNQACRVYLGNSCEPEIGTNYYRCHCSGIYTRDDSVQFPNCFRLKPVCSKVD